MSLQEYQVKELQKDYERIEYQFKEWLRTKDPKDLKKMHDLKKELKSMLFYALEFKFPIQVKRIKYLLNDFDKIIND